jgi:hypothetical protein
MPGVRGNRRVIRLSHLFSRAIKLAKELATVACRQFAADLRRLGRRLAAGQILASLLL